MHQGNQGNQRRPGPDEDARKSALDDDKDVNARNTERIAQNLISLGWMIDYAPGEHGKFFRVVVGREVRKETIEGLVLAIEKAAE